MTTSKDVEQMLLACIPSDMRADGLIEADLIKLGVIDMCSALGITDVSFVEATDFTDDGEEVTYYTIEPELDLFQQRLAGYFCFILYLEKLKLSLNQDAINFSTLTFSIKGLEKRPEAINDMIYQVRRYLDDTVSRLTGGALGILGTARKYGG